MYCWVVLQVIMYKSSETKLEIHVKIEDLNNKWLSIMSDIYAIFILIFSLYIWG